MRKRERVEVEAVADESGTRNKRENQIGWNNTHTHTHGKAAISCFLKAVEWNKLHEGGAFIKVITASTVFSCMWGV